MDKFVITGGKKLAGDVQSKAVIPGIHNLVAGILERNGKPDLAEDLKGLDEREHQPNMYALSDLINFGVESDKKALETAGKMNLESILKDSRVSSSVSADQSYKVSN